MQGKVAYISPESCKLQEQKVSFPPFNKHLKNYLDLSKQVIRSLKDFLPRFNLSFKSPPDVTNIQIRRETSLKIRTALLEILLGQILLSVGSSATFINHLPAVPTPFRAFPEAPGPVQYIIEIVV
jgi:hypothetical protein